MKTTFIYTLSDPRNDAVRYVGKTDVPAARAKSHLKRGHSIKAKWVQSLLAVGIQPVLEVLDEVPFEEWMFWEQHWIQVMRGWGFDLVNGDNGGLGHYRLPEHVAQKISLTLMGRRLPERWKEISSYTLDGNLVKTFSSVVNAAREVGCHHANISRSVRARRAAGGFLWAYGKRTRITSDYVNGRVPPTEKMKAARLEVARRRVGTTMSVESREKMRRSALRRWHGISMEVADGRT